MRDYPWSSWIEYEGTKPCAIPVCNVQHVLNRISRVDILEMICEPLPKSLRILDLDCNTAVRVGDNKVRNYAIYLGINNLMEIQHLPQAQRDNILCKLRQFGASIRQLSRMTGVSFGIIRKLE